MPRMVFLYTILSQFFLSSCQTVLANQVADLQRVRPLLHLADAHIAQGDLTKALPLVI